MDTSRYLTAAEAVAVLGISLPTLYAYVSRGLIRSEAAGQRRRDRRYNRDDVDRLRQRQEQRHHPERAAEQALSWGVPVLESSLSLIVAGRLYYRGLDAVTLAGSRTFEAVAQWLWTGRDEDDTVRLPIERAVLAPYAAWLKSLSPATPVERMQAILPLAAAADLAAYDLRPSAVAQTGARLLNLLVAAAVYPAGAAPPNARLAECLQRGWQAAASVEQADRAARLIDAALILSADHELNTSAFTARCVASVRATPYQVVIAALAALNGLRHGGQVGRVEALFDEAGTPARAETVMGTWLKRGESLPGFGHPLYPDGDPRARTLLERIGETLPRSRQLAVALALVESASVLMGEHPNVDFALVAVARALKLPAGAALALFAVGRTAGWIAHAIEQYQAEPMIRPRARYVGPMPE